MERDLNKKEAGTWKNQLLGLGLTQPGGHRDEPDLSVVAVSLYPFPALWSCLQVCWVLPFAPERHLFSVHYSSPATVAVVVDCRRCPASHPTREEAGSHKDTLPVTLSQNLYTTYMLCSVLVVCASCRDVQNVWTALAEGSVETKRELDENNVDESPHQMGEGTKDAWKTVWWTAVNWLSRLCLCHVALFSLSVSALIELLISLLYILICALMENLILLSPMITDFPDTPARNWSQWRFWVFFVFFSSVEFCLHQMLVQCVDKKKKKNPIKTNFL